MADVDIQLDMTHLIELWQGDNLEREAWARAWIELRRHWLTASRPIPSELREEYAALDGTFRTADASGPLIGSVHRGTTLKSLAMQTDGNFRIHADRCRRFAARVLEWLRSGAGRRAN